MSEKSTVPSFLLDLDGTLMPSHEVDNQCYWQAVGEVTGQKAATYDLNGFTVVTDNGILREWFEAQFGTSPSDDEISTIKDRFLVLTEQAADKYPEAFKPFPGVIEWLTRCQESGWKAGIATGGWGHTARFKLKAAGLETFDLPLATADDADKRVDIMRIGMKRLWPKNQAKARPVYLGDGSWDLAAAKELGWAFIGIASGARARRLRAAGAQKVVADFRSLL